MTRAEEEALTHRYLSRLHRLAADFCAVYCCDYHDVLSDAHVGLVRALRTWDTRKGLTFYRWMTFKVRGAMLSGLGVRTLSRRVHKVVFCSLDRRIRGNSGTTSEVGPAHEYTKSSTIVDRRQPDPAVSIDSEDWIANLFRGLPCRYRYVLRRYYIDGMTLREVGQELGVSATKVRDVLATARQRVRERARVEELCEV